MRLLVVRHAAAEDKAEFARTARSDDLRPLTADGKRDMREGARGLRNVVPKVDVVATSPLVRAIETAEILGAVYEREHVVVDALRPESPYDDLARWAREHAKEDVVVIVGHEPHLSGLVSWLLAGASASFVDLKKGAACLLEIEDTAAAGCAMLLWSVTPRQLRALGRR
ncbi:MAG: histidine phosphatase family protein [Gemmatimonadota bacterium]|nr:histidine phosphatase family protein [Gemmatimonadota bacterium]